MYDANGNPISKTDARNVVTTSTSDLPFEWLILLGRLSPDASVCIPPIPAIAMSRRFTSDG
jgi:hypothetical protein